MEIKAADVKQLRDKTGAGMMDCKKALTEAEGDFAKAERILKELGLAAAAKRSGRATNEGRIFTTITEDAAALLELSCETDFVARNKDFIALGNAIVERVARENISLEDSQIAEQVKEAISTIKENMAARRAKRMEIAKSEKVVQYVHGEGGSIGVLVKVAASKPETLENESVSQFAFDCALHVAAFNPTFLSKDNVPAEYVKEQEEIYMQQARNLGKPEKVLEGIVKGKLNKHLSEICFLEQPFVKDDKRSVAKVAADIGKEIGDELTVAEFAYYKVGEQE